MNIPFFRLLQSRLSSLGADPSDSPELALQKRVLVYSSFLVMLASAVWGLLLVLNREPLAGGLSLFYTLATVLILLRFARDRRYQFFLYSQVTFGLLIPFLQTLMLGGIAASSGIILWSLSSPLGVLLLSVPRRAIPWWLAYLAQVILAGLLQPYLDPENNLPAPLVTAFFVMNITAITSLALVMLIYFVNQKNEAYRLLHIEEQKAQDLLLNILPREIAAILKSEQRTIAEHFEGASILFADLVGFTPLTTSLAPVEMVNLLNKIVSHFDDLVEKYDLEKIRTIGDNYMAASGVPRPRPDHAQAMARLALEMNAYVERLPPVQGRRIEFRIGINSGPVIGGVIGRKKFVYDLWGDAVNVASRMESQGLPGRIQITHNTYELIKNEFVCEPRGSLEVKGRGELQTWFLVGAR